MTTLHPHWQSTDDSNERSIPVRITKKESHSPSPVCDHRSPVRASRHPAALVGIFLFFIAGAAALQGYGLFGLGGQVSQNAVTIDLTANGASPVTVTVTPGTTITWSNDDTIPHVLSSGTLPTTDGAPFVTSAIFPGSNTHVLIPLTATPGAYAYISETSDMVSGQIIVQAADTSVFETPVTTMPVTTVSSSSSSVRAVVASSALSVEAASSVATVAGGQIPVNPYTVGSGNIPLPDRQQPGQHAAASDHIPDVMPETGSATWIAILLAVLAVLFVTRSAFRSL